MKNKILPVLLGCIFFLPAYSQYTPLPDSNAIWRTYFFDYSLGSGIKRHMGKSDHKATGSYEYNGRIYTSVTVHSDGAYPSPDAYLFRQEGKKVYFVPYINYNPVFQLKSLLLDSTGEELVYDFGMQIGDSITHRVIKYNDETDTIILKLYQIDTNWGGGQRDVYRLKKRLSKTGWSWEEWWTEGVGSDGGLFLITGPLFEQIPDFSCVRTYNDSIIYQRLGGDDCTYRIYGVGLKETEAPAPLSLYPNPAKDMVQFDTEVPIKNIKIYDALGRTVELPLESMGTGSIILHTGHLAEGTYFVLVSSGTQISRGVFVKSQ